MVGFLFYVVQWDGRSHQILQNLYVTGGGCDDGEWQKLELSGPAPVRIICKAKGSSLASIDFLFNYDVITLHSLFLLSDTIYIMNVPFFSSIIACYRPETQGGKGKPFIKPHPATHILCVFQIKKLSLEGVNCPS